jgi:predicted MFS family arabinose efflux permease
MATAAALFLIGALAMSVAPTYAILLVGRLVTGVGVGAALLVAPLYTAELAPAGVRGALVSLTVSAT